MTSGPVLVQRRKLKLWIFSPLRAPRAALPQYRFIFTKDMGNDNVARTGSDLWINDDLISHLEVGNHTSIFHDECKAVLAHRLVGNQNLGVRSLKCPFGCLVAPWKSMISRCRPPMTEAFASGSMKKLLPNR